MAWRHRGARPVVVASPSDDAHLMRTMIVNAQIALPMPKQRPLAVYEQLLVQLRGVTEMNS